MKALFFINVVLFCLGFALESPAAERAGKKRIFKFGMEKDDTVSRRSSSRSSKTLVPVPPVTFKIDPRYAEWHTNKAALVDSQHLAEKRGDFLAQHALAFKAAYGEFFFKYFEERGVGGAITLRRQNIENQKREALKRRAVQLEFKNEEAVKEIDRRIKSLEESDKKLAEEIPVQRLAADFVIPDMEESLAGIMFLIAYNEVGDRGVPMKSNARYLKILRQNREFLANKVIRSEPPLEVRKRVLELNETLIKIEKHLLNGEHEEGQRLAHSVATQFLNQE